jgi:ubiquinone/menaquinone biosynthesis C-methylase UbiE
VSDTLPISDSAPAGFGAAFASADAVNTYSTLLVPRMFAPWAELLLDRVRPAPGERLCDVACGPGTVTRAAARRVAPSGSVLGCDISEAMLDTARATPVEPGTAAIEYRLSPAAPLAVESSSVAVVTCQQGLQFFPEAGDALAEMHRVLVTGGRLGIACWRRIEDNPVYHAFEQALAAVFGAERAAGIRKPFSGPAPDDLSELLASAGFVDVDITEEARDLVFEDGIDMALGALLTTPAAADLGGLDAAGREAFHAAGVRALTPLLDAAGAVRAPMRSLMATARR